MSKMAFKYRVIVLSENIIVQISTILNAKARLSAKILPISDVNRSVEQIHRKRRKFENKL